MVREHWLELSQALSEVAHRWKEVQWYLHDTALVARVYCWAAVHNNSVDWACNPKHWDKEFRPDDLPSQSTMSRRTRQKDFWALLTALGKRLDGKPAAGLLHLRKMDGKPLVVAAHTRDRDARCGRGAGQKAKGYKLHAIWSDRPMPDQWRVTPLNVHEGDMARRMIKHLDGSGYLLADGHYDQSRLHDVAAKANHQLIAPRQHPGKGMGHHYQSKHRKRSIEMLEVPANVTRFGKTLHRQRKQIEREFGNLTSYSGGLICLPPWIRRPWRVRIWVHAKLLLNAARKRCVRRRSLVRA
jgi:Transposase DDE domain